MLAYMGGNDTMAQGYSSFFEQMPPGRALHLLLAGMGTAREKTTSYILKAAGILAGSAGLKDASFAASSSDGKLLRTTGMHPA